MSEFQLKKARCIALDINGTLIDGRYKPWEDIFKISFGLQRNPNTEPKLPWARALNGGLSFEELVATAYDTSAMEDLRVRAFEVYMNELRLREGCIHLLESLSNQYNLVVCSDTSGVTKVIAKRFMLENYFSKLFFSCDVGYVKSERMFWTNFLAEFSDMKPEEFIMVGDNPKADIRWPKSLGMGTILIDSTELSGSHLTLDCEIVKPHVHVKTLKEILEMLDKNSAKR